MKINQKLADRAYNVESSVYEAIMASIKNGVRIEFEAIDATRCKETHYEMYPFLLKRDRFCYLYGFSVFGELHVVFIESIRRLVITKDQAPSHIWNESLMERCRCSIGSTFLDETPRIVSDFPVNLEVVILKVYSPLHRAFLLYPFHFSQELIEENEEYSLFRYYVYPTEELVLRILENGDRIEVLYPSLLRSETKKIIQQMLKRY